jgi:hypothetical protein
MCTGQYVVLVQHRDYSFKIQRIYLKNNLYTLKIIYLKLGLILLYYKTVNAMNHDTRKKISVLLLGCFHSR